MSEITPHCVFQYQSTSTAHDLKTFAFYLVLKVQKYLCRVPSNQSWLEKSKQGALKIIHVTSYLFDKECQGTKTECHSLIQKTGIHFVR